MEEVSSVIADALALPRWWPSVYLEVVELAPGAPDTRLGRVLELYTKGWLPYTLRWQLEVIENRHPHGFALRATGDFSGTGRWTFAQHGSQVEVVYEWCVRAEKPLLRHLSFLLKPIFSANHQWAMRMGETSLKLELARRHASDDRERARIPRPPRPTFHWWARVNGARKFF